MPELIIRDLIVERLKDTDYDSRKISKKRNVNSLFKNYIVSMDEDIYILGDNAFEVVIGVGDYNEIIYTETYYQANRVSRQLESIRCLLRDDSSPKAWLLVTVYYHSFFCANLISRLLGRFSCFFNSIDINHISRYAENKLNSNISSGNYVGYFVSCGDGIKMKFSHDGDKPHYTVWKNLHDKFAPGSDIKGSDPDRYNRIQLFKKIINESNKNWPLPSDTRNRWNYSDVFLYTKKGDEEAKEFSALLDCTRDMKWSSRKRLSPDKSNIATSIAFISSTLNRSLDVCMPKILR